MKHEWQDIVVDPPFLIAGKNIVCSKCQLRIVDRKVWTSLTEDVGQLSDKCRILINNELMKYVIQI